MDFIKKGMISTKYLADGCEFKKDKNGLKLISTSNVKYQPFVGQTHSESVWDLISQATVTDGLNHKEVYGLLLDHFQSGQTIFKDNANILLKKGEKIIFQSPNNIILKEPKSIRVTNSVHVGSGRRKGNRSFGYGASKSVGETKEEIRVIDSGQIIITNKRFIYSGKKRNIDVNISQITGITPFTDGFKLQRKSKQKPEYFTNVDAYVFNYNFNGDTYFYIMNGQIIKAMIEGGLIKTPQMSKLQQRSSKKQIDKKIETIKVNFDEFSLEFKSNWKKVADKKESDILSLERMDGIYKAKIHVSVSKITKDWDIFEKEVKNVIGQNEFTLTNLEKVEVNGIEMLSVSSMKNINNQIMEMDVNYFRSSSNQFGIFLVNNQLNTNAKRDYESIINSIKFNNQIEDVPSNSNGKMNFCPNCGIHIEHNGNFCQNCGFKLI